MQLFLIAPLKQQGIDEELRAPANDAPWHVFPRDGVGTSQSASQRRAGIIKILQVSQD
jgi:hypothetical protein